MALLPVQPVLATGLAPVLSAATGGGDTLNCGDHTFLRVNAGATPVTVTVASPVPCNQGSLHPLVVVVAASTEADIGPLIVGRYGNVNGVASVTYNQVATITVAAVSA